ncbi:MAG: ThiF family adenylyltransferase [Pseudomonadota bacterium]
MWWLTDQARLRTEREAIELLDAAWFQNPVWSADKQFRLTLAFDIVIPRGRFPLRLIYHNTFPASPPSVVSIDGETRLSNHQYGAGGDLCLEIRNDNWTPDVNGAMMIESAKRLLEIETPEEGGQSIHAPSAHDYPATLSLRSEVARLYVDPLSRIILEDEQVDELPLEIGLDLYSGSSIIAHIISVGGDEESEKRSTVPRALRNTCVVNDGVFFSVDTSTSALAEIRTFDALKDILGDRLTLNVDTSWSVILRGSEGGLTLFSYFASSDNLRCFTTIVAPFEGDRSGVSYDDIRAKKVGIVGLGSLGSKIAVSLARSGLSQFVLVDGDILHTGNLERHDGDWRDIGRHKVDLTEHRLRLIRSDVDVLAWRSAIGAQVSSQEAANVGQALAACDLVIDATASSDVFNYLAGLSMRHNRSLIWGAVYAGGIGGEMARARIEKDPSPYDIRATMNQFYATSDESAPLATGSGYDGSVGEDAPMQATDADVSVFAAHISAFALDTLADIEPSNYDAHAYLVGLKRGWLFSGPFHTLPIEVQAPLRRVITGGPESAVESDFIKSLFLGEGGATTDTEIDD